VVIYKVNEGVFYSYIYIECAQKEYCVDSRTSDAIALALREPCPIYATEEVMSQEYMQEDAEGQFSVSVKLVSMPVLQQALDNAVRDENYELAAKLRDEIRKREKETKR
jgi:bifunctional DNase/RNase